jgi:lipopolysaccharide export system permease protein
MPFAKSKFDKYVINIDLAKLNNTNSEDAEIVNAHNMLNINELQYTIDSLQKIYTKDQISYSENISQKNNEFSQYINNVQPNVVAQKAVNTNDVLNCQKQY